MKKANTQKPQRTQKPTDETRSVKGHNSIIELEDYLDLEQEKLASFLRVLEIFGRSKYASDNNHLPLAH